MATPEPTGQQLEWEVLLARTCLLDAFEAKQIESTELRAITPPGVSKDCRAFQTTAYSKTRTTMIPDATTMIFESEPGSPRRRGSLGNEGMCEN